MARSQDRLGASRLPAGAYLHAVERRGIYTPEGKDVLSLAPLLGATAAVQIHVATVVPAFFLGTWQIFFSRKGAPFHRALGYLYLALMTIASIAALFVHQLMPNGPFF